MVPEARHKQKSPPGPGRTKKIQAEAGRANEKSRPRPGRTNKKIPAEAGILRRAMEAEVGIEPAYADLQSAA